MKNRRVFAPLVFWLVCESAQAERPSRTLNADSPSPYTGQDHRQLVDRHSREYHQLNAVGAVFNEHNQLSGTGFLVSPCAILTNKHVVEYYKNVRMGHKVTFHVGQTNSRQKPFLTSSEGQVVAMGDGATEQEDWVVVKLQKSVGRQVGYLPMYQMDPRVYQERTVITAGFPGNKTQGGKELVNMYGDLDCKAPGMGGAGEMVHHCQTTRGQSGSPILTKAPNGKYYAIGMVQGIRGNGMERGEKKGVYNAAVGFTSGKPWGVEGADADLIMDAVARVRCG